VKPGKSSNKTNELLLENSYLDAVHFFEGFAVSPICIEIAILAKKAGFQDVGEEDAQNCWKSLSLPLTKAEFTKLDKEIEKKHRAMMTMSMEKKRS
jgi:hypothetical protein